MRIRSGMTVVPGHACSDLNLAMNLTKLSDMTSVSVHEAKTHLSRLLREVAEGREIEVTNRNRVVARIVPPAAPKKKPLLGALAGKITFDLEDGFFDPLPDDELALWNGEGD